MPLDTVTLVLSGEVPVAQFAAAVKKFADLIGALSSDVGASDVEWMVDDLNAGSTFAVVKGHGFPDKIERVVRAYGEVGVALQQRERLTRYSPRVKSAAYALRRIPGGRIDSVRLETAEREAILRPIPPRELAPIIGRDQARAPQEITITPAPVAFGAVEGRVQTLSNRGGLRFTLYDLLNDKAVSCYLAEGSEGAMRDAWGKLAVVEGLISRDPLSGRPLAIRRVRNVAVLPERETTGYRDARGVSPALTPLLPEHAIRRLRDA